MSLCRQVLREVFDRMDRDGSGHVVKQELVAAIARAVRALWSAWGLACVGTSMHLAAIVLPYYKEVHIP